MRLTSLDGLDIGFDRRLEVGEELSLRLHGSSKTRGSIGGHLASEGCCKLADVVLNLVCCCEEGDGRLFELDSSAEADLS